MLMTTVAGKTVMSPSLLEKINSNKRLSKESNLGTDNHEPANNAMSAREQWTHPKKPKLAKEKTKSTNHYRIEELQCVSALYEGQCIYQQW